MVNFRLSIAVRLEIHECDTQFCPLYREVGVLFYSVKVKYREISNWYRVVIQ